MDCPRCRAPGMCVCDPAPVHRGAVKQSTPVFGLTEGAIKKGGMNPLPVGNRPPPPQSLYATKPAAGEGRGMAQHPTPPVPRAWNGGSRESAMEAAKRRHQEATDRLAAAWNSALPGLHPFDCDAPFRDPATPGYVFLPIEQVAIFETTYDRICRQAEDMRRRRARGEG